MMFLGALTLALTACGGSDDESTLFGGDAGSSGACTPGQSVACVGPGGCQGGQVCRADGEGFEACECGGDAGGSDAAVDAPQYPGMPGDGCDLMDAQDMLCHDKHGLPARYLHCRHPWPGCIAADAVSWCCDH